MPKINREEYEILKTKLREDYKWVAKEMALNVWVRVYKEHPDIGFPGIAVTEASNLFQFIKWEDDEPYNITELIEEYEYWQRIAQNPTVANLVGYRNESEETEVKNIEWFMEQMKSMTRMRDTDSYEESWYISEDALLEALDQLNEPEVNSQIDKLANFIMSEVEGEPSRNQGAVDTAIRIIKSYQNQETLSQEWIDEHQELQFYEANDTADYFVRSTHLQSLLVPKQDEVDRAYKDGYEKGKQHTFYKGYLEGLADKEKEPETVADVVSTFWKSFERLKEVMNIEVEELEE